MSTVTHRDALVHDLRLRVPPVGEELHRQLARLRPLGKTSAERLARQVESEIRRYRVRANKTQADVLEPIRRLGGWPRRYARRRPWVEALADG